MSKEVEKLAADKKAAELKEKQEIEHKAKDATALAEKEQTERIEALRLQAENEEAEKLAADKMKAIQPTLLDQPASPEFISTGETVTIENQLGVRHTVSSTVAKVLAGDPNIKIVK